MHIADLRRAATTLGERVLQIPGAGLALRIVRELATSGLTDRSMTLAAQAFTSVLPIVILTTTIPVGRRYLDKALSGFGVEPDRLDILTGTAENFATFGVVGALMVVAGATSLSRALGRMYVDAWHVRRLAWQGWWRWVIVIFLIPLGALAQGLITPLHTLSLSGITVIGFGGIGVAVEVVSSVLIWSLVWTVIPRLLVSAQVPMRLLALNGAVTGLALTILLIGSRVVLPATMPETTRHFGTLGLVFVAISWLFIYAGILVVCATVVHAVISDDGPLGRLVSRHTGRPHAFAPDTAS